MRWANVQLIFGRELRDQLRDRRTVFTVVVLPLLLYPMMGMALLQIAQFMREQPTRVAVIGAESLPTPLPLFADGKFADEWAPATAQMSAMTLFFETELPVSPSWDGESEEAGAETWERVLQKWMRENQYDLVLLVPDAFGRQLQGGEAAPTAAAAEPRIHLVTDSASDRSMIALERVQGVLNQWRQGLVKRDLVHRQLPAELLNPFEVRIADLAESPEKQAAAWSKILPFVLVIWCLTGAFYPAVDLCAGEKERGTFETLLSSPAQRGEIAIGKLLTVMTFSIATSLLNLASMGFTGMFILARLGAAGLAGGMASSLGMPPLSSIGWLLLAVIPVSAFFSAMALSAAAFARSSKEGQYYLVPLIMVSMPLMMVPMLPAARLDLGTSLIPISGLMLLLRGLMEGHYSAVLPWAGPVVAVTLVCCWLAVRWVVRQFNSETVLFPASERFGVGAWVRQVFTHRHEIPSVGNALLCGVMILVLKFFVGFSLAPPAGWLPFAKQTVVILLATVAVPAILMALVLTTNPRRTLRLRGCRWSVLAAALLAAICLHPLVMGFTTVVMYLYPPSGDLTALESAVSSILQQAPSLAAVLLVFAVAPAIMEEVAFRGFILSGFEGLRSRWAAVLAASLFFGLAHTVFQQSLITFGIGLILGGLAIQTRSLLPCIFYHAAHNGLTVLFSLVDPAIVSRAWFLDWALVPTATGSFQYALGPGILMSVTGLLILTWILQGRKAISVDLGRRPSGHADWAGHAPPA